MNYQKVHLLVIRKYGTKYAWYKVKKKIQNPCINAVILFLAFKLDFRIIIVSLSFG
jgi:hypothetical protein